MTKKEMLEGVFQEYYDYYENGAKCKKCKEYSHALISFKCGWICDKKTKICEKCFVGE